MRAERLSEAFLEIKQEGNAFLTGVLVRQKQSVEEIDVLEEPVGADDNDEEGGVDDDDAGNKNKKQRSE